MSAAYVAHARARPIDVCRSKLSARRRASRDIGNISTCLAVRRKPPRRRRKTNRKHPVKKEKERERGEQGENGRSSSSSSSSIRSATSRLPPGASLRRSENPFDESLPRFHVALSRRLGSSRSMKMLITAANRRAGDNERPALHLESPAACAKTRLNSASALVCAARMSHPRRGRTAHERTRVT